MQIIVISPLELAEIIRVNVREALAEQARPSVSTSKPLSIDEAAKYLGIPKNTLYQLTSTREIPHQKPGKRLVFLAHQLDEWIISKKKKTRQEIEAEATMYPMKGSRK
ncbi:helix-turn-helix domain-containing protein [Runella sp.]|uniref:helix-turn-helix domain-containing protein n=1 Tax=Runella sp. TaxID=1960881 RepID=UPI003D1504D1